MTVADDASKDRGRHLRVHRHADVRQQPGDHLATGRGLGIDQVQGSECGVGDMVIDVDDRRSCKPGTAVRGDGANSIERRGVAHDGQTVTTAAAGVSRW